MVATVLSPRQSAILAFVREFIAEHSYPPCNREIRDGCGISSSSVVDYNLTILAKLGYIRRHPEIARGITLVPNNSTPSTCPHCGGEL